MKKEEKILEVFNLTCINVCGKVIFENVNFKLYKEEIVTITGPNGSGKTSLVKSILGFKTVSNGRVKIKDGIKIGYLPQARNMHTYLIPLSCEDYLNLSPNSTNKQKFNLAINLAGFQKEWFKLPIQKLSGGQQQKLLLTRSLITQPDLLILDEPTCHLDLESQKKLYNSLLSIKEIFKATILIVSHDLNIMMRHSNRILYFDKKIIYSDNSNNTKIKNCTC